MHLLISLLLAIVTLSPAYPPCLTDETGPEFPACYWDASQQGNGQGMSFLWTGQEVIELH